MGCGSSKTANVVINSNRPPRRRTSGVDFTGPTHVGGDGNLNNNKWTSKEANSYTPVGEDRPVALTDNNNTTNTPVKAEPKPITVLDNKPVKEKQTNVESEKLIFKECDFIDAEKFSDISFEEIPNLKPESPQEMWAIVKGSTNKKKLEVEPAKNRKGWRTIRLFVSSTFKDFHHEREVLVKEVFPDLRIWCEERKLRLVECDLRWGVPKDATTEETIKICLGEIDRCYEDNTAPFFLNLAGDRSGWIPDFGDLTYNLAAQYGWVYGLSVTEMEIVHGAFRKLNPNALFMIRESDDIDTLPESKRNDFRDCEPHLLEKVRTLKDVIKATFPESRVIHYNAKCKARHDGDVEFVGVGGDDDCGFSKAVHAFFKTRIEELYPLDPSPEDPLEVQREEHETFLSSRGTAVYGRDDILRQIREYYMGDNSRTPLRIVGVAGAGKSAVMAKSAHDACTSVERKEITLPRGFNKWRVFYHFVGATPGSTDLAFFLQRLTKEIKPDSKDVVSDLESLIQLSGSLLSNPYTEPIIVFVDAINQLDEDKQQFLTRWLPEELSPNVRVVVSTIKDTTSHEMLKQNKRITTEIFCGPLDISSRETIVKNYLVQYNKRLDQDQMMALLEKDGSSNPLWLTFACEELRVFGQFDKLLDKIESLPDDLISLEEDMFSRFEEDGGGHLMIAALCMLEASRHGLLETELLALLGEEANTRLPEFKDDDTTLTQAEKVMNEETAPIELEKDTVEQLADKFAELGDKTYVVKNNIKEKGVKKERKNRKIIKYLPARDWALIYRNLKPLLRPCGNLGGGRLDFYHRSLSKAVRKKYFSGSEDYVRFVYNFWHGVLASYFEEVDDLDRKAEELPYHLEHLMDNSRLLRCLLEWPIFNRLFSPDFSIDLIHSWQKAGGYPVAAAMYKESVKILRESGNDLKDYAEQLERVVSFLSQCGQHSDSLELLEERLHLEEKVLGKRAEKMADVYQLMAGTKSEIIKNYNYMLHSQLPEDKEVVRLCRKSLEYRADIPGKEQRYKEALINVIICFHVCTIIDITSDSNYRPEAREAINNAMQVFEEAQDLGHLADCWMTKTFVNPRYEISYFQENEKDMFKSLELCRKAYGEKHMLTCRIYLNSGIMYEEAHRPEEAFDCYMKLYDIAMEVLGPHHPTTKRAVETLNEPVYKRIKRERAQQQSQTNNDAT